MKRIYNSFECPYCNGKDGTNINCKSANEFKKEKNSVCQIITIRKIYNCYCYNCQKKYQVNMGFSRLIKYNPYIYNAINDTKTFVEYESNYDRSYKIVETSSIPMLILENEEGPVIITNEEKSELIADHDKARQFTLKKQEG